MPDDPAMTPAAPEPRPLRRDQRRSFEAYKWAEAAHSAGRLPDYEIAVQTFAAALLQKKLAVAASLLEAKADRPGFQELLRDLSSYDLPFLRAGDRWPERVRGLDTASYMLATLELRELLQWLKRACQAVSV